MATRLKPGGVGEYFGPYKVETVHSSTCFHCQRITEFPSLKKMHEYVEVCRSCMKLICLECANKPCRPFEKLLEKKEARARMLRDMGF